MKGKEGDFIDPKEFSNENEIKKDVLISIDDILNNLVPDIEAIPSSIINEEACQAYLFAVPDIQSILQRSKNLIRIGFIEEISQRFLYIYGNEEVDLDEETLTQKSEDYKPCLAYKITSSGFNIILIKNNRDSDEEFRYLYIEPQDEDERIISFSIKLNFNKNSNSYLEADNTLRSIYSKLNLITSDVNLSFFEAFDRLDPYSFDSGHDAGDILQFENFRKFLNKE